MAELFKTLVECWVATQSGTNGLISFFVNVYPMLVVGYFSWLVAFFKSYRNELLDISVSLMKAFFKGLAKLANLFN